MQKDRDIIEILNEVGSKLEQGDLKETLHRAHDEILGLRIRATQAEARAVRLMQDVKNLITALNTSHPPIPQEFK